ncbi:PPE domain-containing protein [Gandjariella thermophila]|uniref:PPE domain-containing protein n=1 Tax=Gandjariella thermophila TaxID=1931992 RepID=A0A4D4J5B2_9PSEU|nr:PPE domain-containing protein [Gandjariella thermophila]GDY29153.1 hypothetical protein GTS_07860 [Gandjariella thermophila]
MSGDHRWQGYTHEELFTKLNSGPGPSASAASAERWRGVADALAEIDQELSRGVAASGAAWEGVAAEAARAGIGPLAEWAAQARTSADVMRLSAELQADYVSKARAEMPRPVAVTSEQPGAVVRGLTHLFGGQTDYENQEAERSAAEQRAFQVMADYESNTASNTSSLGRFGPPPEVVGAAAPMHGDSAGAAAHRSGGVPVRAGEPVRAGAAGPRETGRRPGREASRTGHGAAEPGRARSRTGHGAGGPGQGASRAGEGASESEPHPTAPAPRTPGAEGTARPAAAAPDGPTPGNYLVRAEDGFGNGMMVSPPVIGGDA